MKRSIVISDMVLKALGLLLLTAAVLKGYELLTVPVANKDLWSWRPLLIFQVEVELALGIWLLSGLFKPLAWLASLLCFGLFCCVTLYLALTGAASCGCFGTVHVNPWITLAVIDLPAVVLLSALRPKGVRATLACSWTLALRTLRLSLRAARRLPRSSHSHLRTVLLKSLSGFFSARVLATCFVGLIALGASTPILALGTPATVTSTYEVLEPETWVGKDLSILQYIDIAETLSTGRWLVLLYHYDCPDCGRIIPQYARKACDLAGNPDFPRIALVAIPPYGPEPIGRNSPCALGRLAGVKEWFVTTPTVMLMANARVVAAWEEDVPNLSSIVDGMASPENAATVVRSAAEFLQRRRVDLVVSNQRHASW